MTASAAWELIAANEGRRRWTRSGVIQYSSDKNVAEQKCRQDQSHGLPDSLGLWDASENHLSEYRPYLNNVSTAIRRTLAEAMMKDFEGYLGVKFWPELFDGDDEDDKLAQYYAQPHYEQVGVYWAHRAIVENADPPLQPPRRGDRQMPWEFLEYVPPQQQSASRLRSLESRLTRLLSENESQIPMEDPRILRGRTPEVQADNERLIVRTMQFIYELLAFDSGISDGRMKDMAAYFDSICLGQWFTHLGNPTLSQTAAAYPADWDNENLHMCAALTQLCNVMRANNLDSTRLWSSFAYNKVLPDQTRSDAKGEDVQLAALGRWSDFYKTYMEIVASVMVSHTRVRQDRLDTEIANGWVRDTCDICINPWDVNGRHSYPVYIPCGNNHIICLACFMHTSLEPTSPYTRLDGTKTCPTCRGVIQYRRPLMSFTNTLGMWAGVGSSLHV